jgi:predicted glycosyltransferase
MSQAVLQRLQDRAQTNPRLRILQFLVEPIPLLKHAERLVAMGGYNTMCEIFSFQKRALIAPRAVPRREQLIRAQRLQQMGIVDLLSWGNVTPDAISNWLAKDLPPFRLNGRIDLNGLKRIPRLLAQILRNEEALNPV